MKCKLFIVLIVTICIPLIIHNFVCSHIYISFIHHFFLLVFFLSRLKNNPTINNQNNIFNNYTIYEKLFSNILYSSMLLESHVTESALLLLSIEILAIRGALPVGEIGKLLSDMTTISNLSQKLKEKFGGLKKFLEKFPKKFVISNDHPFNPNVLLRNTISAEHLELIDKGIFPHQLLLKMKKVLN
jgi:hypothetical protein